MIYIGTDRLQRKHKVYTEKIMTAEGAILYRISSAIRFESEQGNVTPLMEIVAGLGQLTGEDETLVWTAGIKLIKAHYSAEDAAEEQLLPGIDSPSDHPAMHEHDVAAAQFHIDWNEGRLPVDPSILGFGPMDGAIGVVTRKQK